ncbi:hypothetical protein SAMN03080615_00940 [Amphritea atlantica]|uniref:Uncharacterized protein n=1 Tax=Amphritea atlantica TaxID=355243 RepID=A0A1H9EJY0_9GAMM|nr:hypothetical protein SAMN03080615_00940 [Amphritea atlantica]
MLRRLELLAACGEFFGIEYFKLRHVAEPFFLIYFEPFQYRWQVHNNCF